MRIPLHSAIVPAVMVGFIASLPLAASAQSGDAKPVQRWPSAAERVAVAAPAPGPTAIDRIAQPAGPALPTAQPRLEQRRSPGGSGGNRSGTVRGGGGGGTAGPRVAVPRASSGGPRTGTRPGRVVVAPRVYTYPYYYPFAYSGFYGPGFYDSYWWGGGWGWGPGWGPGWGGYYSAAPGYAYGRSLDVGRVRLQVRPRDAEVFVDGYYAGQVDDFDGRFQGLQLETGGYSIEIRKPGWETLTFDVRVTPDRTTTYKGELIPQKSVTAEPAPQEP